jgi:TolB protein
MMKTIPLIASAVPFVACSVAVAQHGYGGGPAEPIDWRSEESGVLSNYLQLTPRDTYIKAGEAYFNHDASWIVFQAVLAPSEGETPATDYSMFAAPLLRDDAGNIEGLGETVALSTPGAATTCGWWHPSEPGLVLYGSTLEAPKQANQPGYQRGTGRYKWAFPVEMEIVTQRITESGEGLVAGEPEVMFSRDGYDAEGSWSPDGRHVLYANVDMEKSAVLERPDADLWVYDTRTGLHTLIVGEEGYDGGPFFSPDGKWITYRSDRRGDNLLQLFIAELRYDDSGRITGIEREVALTDNRHVNWAPYWHPSGRFLVYSTSEVSHGNYEVFAIPALDASGEPVEDGTPGAGHARERVRRAERVQPRRAAHAVDEPARRPGARGTSGRRARCGSPSSMRTRRRGSRAE